MILEAKENITINVITDSNYHAIDLLSGEYMDITLYDWETIGLLETQLNNDYGASSYCIKTGVGGTEMTNPINESVVRYRYESSNVSINTSSSTALNKIDSTTPVLPVGTYRITISYGWSLDSTGSDFMCRAKFGSSYLGVATSGSGDNYVHVQEPQDSGGSSFDGRGTNQILGFTNTYFVELITEATQDVLLQYRPSGSGVEASMWDVKIEITKL